MTDPRPGDIVEFRKWLDSVPPSVRGQAGVVVSVNGDGTLDVRLPDGSVYQGAPLGWLEPPVAGPPIKVGDRVQFVPTSPFWAAHPGVGTVLDIRDLPGNGRRVYAEFLTGTVEGVLIDHLQHAYPHGAPMESPTRPRIDMAGNANPGESPLPLRVGAPVARAGQPQPQVSPPVQGAEAHAQAGEVSVRIEQPARPGTLANVTQDARGTVQPPGGFGSDGRGTVSLPADLVPINGAAGPLQGSFSTTAISPLEVPAAGRVVPINHNTSEVREVKATLDTLIAGIRGVNDLFADADEKLAIESELRDLREAMEGPTVRLRRMYDAVQTNGVIKWLADKAGGGIVSAAATAATIAILRWIGAL